MKTSISDPFLLASYSISKRLLNPKPSKNPDANPSANVHITYTDSKSDGYATATVQGDGIHLLDVCPPCYSEIYAQLKVIAKGPFSDVDFFAPSGALPHPWSLYNVRLSRRLKYIGDRWKE